MRARLTVRDTEEGWACPKCGLVDYHKATGFDVETRRSIFECKGCGARFYILKDKWIITNING